MAKRKQKGRSANALDDLGRYRAVAQMVGGLVHQFRTPIHIIQASAEDMAGAAALPVEFKQHAELIARGARRLEATVNGILNFVKGGKLSLQRGSLQEAIEQLGDFINEERLKRNVTLEKKLESRQSIRLDLHHLQEALLNVLMNALQAMPKGGTLTIRTADVPGTHKVMLEISDTGAGMDKAMLGRLATPFHTNKKQGMGLGLFFTRKIAEQHRAKIYFVSRKGKGTTVRMVFLAA